MSEETVTQRPVAISASMMCVDWLNAGAQLQKLHDMRVEYLHWDVIDGWFAPDFCMGTSIINAFRAHATILSDYHLMVEEPARLFDAFEITPGDMFTIHQECCRNLHRDLVSLRRRGARVGVAVCPGTPLETLEYVIEDLDHVLLMTVNPGYKGQPLVPQTIRKIARLREIIDNDLKLDVKIAVDGNVNFENTPEMVAAGADLLVAGSSGLFRKDMTLEESHAKLRESIAKGLALRKG